MLLQNTEIEIDKLIIRLLFLATFYIQIHTIQKNLIMVYTKYYYLLMLTHFKEIIISNNFFFFKS